jgi:quercetin dioxygenase-like cupin family protein
LKTTCVSFPGSSKNCSCLLLFHQPLPYLTADTYYFKPGQILAYHRHPDGDQIFFILKGQGTFYLDNGTEEQIEVREGSIIYVPKGIYHKLEANGELVACQATKAGAGNQARA